MQAYWRKGKRVALPVSATIKVRDDNGIEHTHQGQVLDASSYGLKLKVNKYFQKQTILFLTLPFPLRFRQYSFSSERYCAYAEVVHSKRFAAEDYEIGVKLLHNKAPLDFKPFSVDESA